MRLWMNIIENQQPLRFERVPDSEGDNNRGWRVDRLDAYLNGQVGYLKMSYIPHDRFQRYYRTIFNYMAQIQGTHVLPFGQYTGLYTELSDKELKTLLWYSQGWTPTEPEGTHEQLLQMAKQREQDLLNGRVGKLFEEFRAFHVDKPLVDYIHVEPGFRRQGIGTALYLEGARWMADQGMKLYRSGVQMDEATAAWEKLAQKGLVGEDQRGMFVKLPSNNA
jgi:GNAT superfamily N-acetyltransferase